MMSPKRWILLLTFYISYLMFGASIYYHIEHNLEQHKRAEALQQRIEINEYLVDQLSTKRESIQNEVLQKITDYCGKPVTNHTLDEFEEPYTWTFYHSFFFAFTVCSTVGYGNLVPTTTLGRMIMIAYSIIGMPINGILFTGLGDYFGKTFEMIYKRYKEYKRSHDVRYVPPQLGLFATVTIALIPGITFFILLPAWLFSYFENWPYSSAIYYSYVTTTTIGFGDFVPTFQSHQSRTFGGWYLVYQIFVIVWFIFSLGYLLMIMTFITKGLRSKKLARLEQQLSANIKATHSRIWSGVTKDVGYLRRILNELYIMKFKPVYNEPRDRKLLYRSISCPELQLYRADSPIPSRKRAFSECYDLHENQRNATPPMRTNSDTELDKFDKQKTFETAEAYRQTTDLLAKVVTALSKIEGVEEKHEVGSSDMFGGYHGFSDSQILSSEWSNSASNFQIPQRGRACSDFNISPKLTILPSHEWTWSGDNMQIQQAINDRVRFGHEDGNGDLYKSAMGIGYDYPNVVVNIDDDEPKRRKKFSIPNSFRRLFKKRSSQDLISGSNRKFSVISVPEGFEKNLKNDHYSTITASDTQPYFKSSNGFDKLHKLFSSEASLATKLSAGNNFGFSNGVSLQESDNNFDKSFQQTASATKKRRDSLFIQNPALSNRRGSTFLPKTTSTAAATINNRRGSMTRAAAAAAMNNRKASLLSTTMEDELAILENTTIADLIRHLESIHRQEVLQPLNEKNLLSGRKKSRTGASTTIDYFSPLSVLSERSEKSNRLHSRRSTIVGTMPLASTTMPMPTASFLQAPTPSSFNVLTRRRLSSVQAVDPPPSYSEKEPTTAATTKFKRRFSIRPTSLQIPPGKAPLPEENTTDNDSGISNFLTVCSSTPQTSLQRRISLRPSPLARQLNVSNISNDSQPTSLTAATRLAAFNIHGGPTTSSSSSSHSPLSRIVQITQAHRRSSTPDVLAASEKNKNDSK